MLFFRFVFGLLIIILSLNVSFCSFSFAYNNNSFNNETKGKIIESYGKLPLYFIKNQGQIDKKVYFYEKGIGRSFFFTKDGVYITLNKVVKKQDYKFNNYKLNNIHKENTENFISEYVALKLVNANKNTEIVAEEMLPGKVNYFIGNNPNTWKIDIPTYAKIRYKEVYPGIDLVFYGNQRQLEYDVVVSPGADYRLARFKLEGAKKVERTEKGDLKILLKNGGIIVQKKPHVFQEINGNRVEVSSNYKIFKEKRDYFFSFELGDYDRHYALIIDPFVISYSSYLGGNGSFRDEGYAIAVDVAGNAYVTGLTMSSDFPTTSGVYNRNYTGNWDVFVTKINPTGSALVFSTYLGGAKDEVGYGIAVDASGNTYITGFTSSFNFPTTQGAFDTSYGGLNDVFVSKLNSTGTALVYSTYLGGFDNEVGTGITVDFSGNAYITGVTNGKDFPTTSRSFSTSLKGSSDAFLSKLNSTGTNILYSTYLGGSKHDSGHSIAIDSLGNAYITGRTESIDFPTTLGSYDTTFNGGIDDIFVSKFDSTFSNLLYSTYIGGNKDDVGSSIALDSSGNAYLTGYTYSSNFPTTIGAYDTRLDGLSDAFVTKLNSNGSALAYSTYLGGASFDFGRGIALDVSGNAYVVGDTLSSDFSPNTSGTERKYYDVFVSKLNSTGNNLIYITYLEGRWNDYGRAISLDTLGNVYVTGYTWSENFPTTQGAFDTTFGGSDYCDVFVTKFIEQASNTFTISTTSDPSQGGTIICHPNPVPQGLGATCSITPNHGYILLSVGGTCGGTLSGNIYKTNPINTNCTIHARFTTTGVQAINIITCDLNNDNTSEIIKLSSNSNISYYNQTTNMWTNIPGSLTQVVCGDVNGDSKMDIVGLNSVGEIYYTVNLGQQWLKVPGNLTKIGVADLNGDGKADIYGLNSSNMIFVTYNLNSWFNIPGLLEDILHGDFNPQRAGLELVGLNNSGFIYYTPNLLNWTNIPGYLQKLYVGRLNRDLTSDVLGLNAFDDIYFTVNLLTWQNIPGKLKELAVGDFDADGIDDIIVFNASNDIYYTINRQNWFQIPGQARGLATGDINGDGRSDVVIIGMDGRVYYTLDLKKWTRID